MLLEWLETQQQQAESTLQAQLGNQTWCEIHTDGQVTGGLKYEEGRLIVITTLRRQLKSGDQDPQSMIEVLLNQWQQQLEHHIQQKPSSMPWIAYSQGGVDMCREALHQLS
ncbi:MAG: hypothetical protein H6673_05160 [Anaerolineales bacterium]|nr:hypothetical protein [Anaerolineales bacterium]